MGNKDTPPKRLPFADGGMNKGFPVALESEWINSSTPTLYEVDRETNEGEVVILDFEPEVVGTDFEGPDYPEQTTSKVGD